MYRNRPITRRKFMGDMCKGAAITSATALSLKTIIISTGCSYLRTVTETTEEVDEQIESHPAFPTPKNGCYLGWHHSLHTLDDADGEIRLLNRYYKTFDQYPVVHGFSDRGINGSWFPRGIIEGAHNTGVIPLIRFYPFFDWERISKGEFDDNLESFAKEALKTQKSFFFTPFPEAGQTSGSHPWQRWNSKYFKDAWNRMFTKFEGWGVNEFAIWGLHLLENRPEYKIKPRKNFWVPHEQVHWVGVSTWGKQDRGSKSFRTLVSRDYAQMRKKYPTKPFAVWEAGNRHIITGSGESYGYVRAGKWLAKAAEEIKKRPSIKLVVPYDFHTGRRKLGMNILMKETAEYYQKIVDDPYFISSGK